MSVTVSQPLVEGTCSKEKVYLFSHYSLLHRSGNQDTDYLHIFTCDPSTSLPDNFKKRKKRVRRGWLGSLQQLPQPAQGCPIDRASILQGLTVNLNTFLAWGAQYGSLRPSAKYQYTVMRGNGQEGVLSHAILAPLLVSSPHPAIQNWKRHVEKRGIQSQSHRKDWCI